MNTISKLWTKLKDKEYRQAFVWSQMTIGIPFQIRALLKSRDWTQEELAQEADMLQPRISALLRPGKTSPNIKTLCRLATAFDCGLIVRFVPFSELARWSETFNPESYSVPRFEQENAQVALASLRKPLANATQEATVAAIARASNDSIRVAPELTTAGEGFPNSLSGHSGSVISISSARTQEIAHA